MSHHLTKILQDENLQNIPEKKQTVHAYHEKDAIILNHKKKKHISTSMSLHKDTIILLKDISFGPSFPHLQFH